MTQDGPSITASKWGKYTYQSETKKLHKFKYDLSQDSVTVDLFNNFNRPRKAQVILNSLSGVLAVSTISLASETADDSALGAFIVALFGTAATGTVFGIGNLLTGPRKAKAKRELIKHINLGNADPSTAIKKNFNYATPIVYHEQDRLYSLHSVTNKFHLLGPEISKDYYSTAEFENYLIFRKRRQRALLVSYTFGSVVLGSQILNALRVVNEDTARGDSYRLFTLVIPIATALGSVGFSIVFAKRKNASKARIINYINGQEISYKTTPQMNFRGGITQNGFTLSLTF